MTYGWMGVSDGSYGELGGGGHGRTDWDERDVGHGAVGLAEEDNVDADCKEGGHGPDDLVEGDSDEVAVRI